MQDRLPLYPGRVKLTPVSGQESIYDMERADEPTQIGTAINKANLLKDGTAALFGLSSNAVPDDVHNWVGQYNTHWWGCLNTSTGATTYVNSTNRNAYPDDGTVGTLTYRYLGIPFDNAVKSPEMEMGSYVGTGLTGEANPNSLTFNFAPRLVLIWGGLSGLVNLFFFVRGATTYTVVKSSGASYAMNCTFNGNNLSWYSTYYIFQANDEGTRYRYVAFK